MSAARVEHLYVHVPFCPTICPYCDFHVLERRGDAVSAYLAELDRDAAELERAYDANPRTVYVGGGTPSFLRDRELARLVDVVRSRLGWAAPGAAGGEATLEVNPGTVTAARARFWRELGFDRASVGVQSAHDDVLRFLGRTHDAAQAFRAVNLLLDAGFRVSADVITAVPGQDVERDLRAIAALGVEHVSAYTLTIEDGTPFARRGVTVRADDEERALDLAESVLAEFGLARYEVSNHARRGAESRHNLAYWENRFYFGLGPGAAGHYPLEAGAGAVSVRRKNPPLDAWLRGERGEPELVSGDDFITDALFAGLRLRDGVNLERVSRAAGVDARSRFAAVFDDLESRGLLEFDGPVVRATPDGVWVLNQVVAAFL